MRHLYLSGIFALMLSGAPALAQDSGEMVMKTPGLETRAAPPPWSTAKDVEQTSEIFRNLGTNEGGTTYQILEMTPKGENLQDWSQLYAIVVEKPLTDPFQNYLNGQFNAFAQNCAQASLFHQQDVSETAKVFIVMCSAYKNNAAQGEVGFFRMELAGTSMVKVYHLVRVPAFDIATVGDTPPIPVDDMKAMLERVGNTKVAVTSGG